MKMDSMRWDGAENCCASLRIIAELVRRGEVTCMKITGSGDAATIRLDGKPTGRKR